MASRLQLGVHDVRFQAENEPNNFFAVRNRNLDARQGFRFFIHDAEHTLLDVNQDRTGPFAAGNDLATSNPHYFFQRLWASPDFKMRVALAQLGPAFRIEIIEPLDDRSLYAASLRQSGGADHIHHVRLDVSDFAGARNELGALGLEVRFDATFRGGSPDGHRVRGMYFDARDDLGFLLEIAEAPPGFSMPQPDYVYPPEA